MLASVDVAPASTPCRPGAARREASPARRLAESLGLSRLVVRQGLRGRHGEGLIVTKRGGGRGAIVCNALRPQGRPARRAAPHRADLRAAAFDILDVRPLQPQRESTVEGGTRRSASGMDVAEPSSREPSAGSETTV